MRPGRNVELADDGAGDDDREEDMVMDGYLVRNDVVLKDQGFCDG